MEKKNRSGAVIFSPYVKGEAVKKVVSMKREDVLFDLRESKLKGRGGA